MFNKVISDGKIKFTEELVEEWGESMFDDFVENPLRFHHFIRRAKKVHYERNRFNNAPKFEGRVIELNWIKLPQIKSIFHQQIWPEYGVDGRGNSKYISPDGTQEAVYDKDGLLVTDTINMGTFNYGAPIGILGMYRHVKRDVVPYYLFGNTPEDPTKVRHRLFASYYIKKAEKKAEQSSMAA
jgi:hypothetical protein